MKIQFRYLLFSLVLGFTLITFSCKKDEVVKPKDSFVGTYTGVFLRTSPNVDYFPTTVNLVFSTDSFYGQSGSYRYPAICAGVYTVTGQEIEFQNSCFWTADFDWTLILSGKFQIYKNDTLLRLTKQLGNDTFDKYELKKK